MCKSDCSGPVTGWLCVDGDFSNPSNCFEDCGDGLVVGTETCDDGLVNNEGCASDCKGVLPGGWICIGGTPTTTT